MTVCATAFAPPKEKAVVSSGEATSKAALAGDAGGPAAPYSSTEAMPTKELGQLTQAEMEKGAPEVEDVEMERSFTASVGPTEKGDVKYEPAAIVSAAPATPRGLAAAAKDSPDGFTAKRAAADSNAEQER